MKIAMVFPGYGSQFVGMGKELYDQHRIIQEYFEEASSCLDKNFVKLCFASSDAELARMSNAYTAIFLVSASIYALLEKEGIKPDVVAGYNLGEYAALFAAKGITLPDGLYLLNKYATFYNEALESMNVHEVRIQGCDAKTIEDICFKASNHEQKVFVALYESPLVHIVAGDSQAIDRLRDIISDMDAGIEIDFVDTAIGLHSPLMEPVINQFRMYLEKVDFKDLQMPLIDSIDGKLIELGERIRNQELKRISSPVFWTRIVKALADYDLIIEVGPGTHLSQLLIKEYPDKHIIAINKPEDLKELRKLIPQKKEEKPQDQSENNGEA